MSKAVVARPIDGITINTALEFLLDDDGEVRMFDSPEQAKSFLTAAGVEPEELHHMTIMESCGICRKCAVRYSRACHRGTRFSVSPVTRTFTNLNRTHEEGSAAMRVLVVEPEHRPEVREIDDSLKVMQNIVGGYIQPIHLDDSVVLVCNEEGKLMDMPANRGLRDKNGQMYDIVFGTFFLCNSPADCDHFTSLTPEQIKRYQERFYTPEMFWGMDGRIVCLPLEVD